MNTEDQSANDIKITQDKLVAVERTEEKIRNRSTHEGFADAQRVIVLADEEEALETTLTHEKERQASDWH